ncbi:glycosyltransferase family 4 protein [Candidatus Dependentiae bacterium]|nr:glycosyltransferase family 4 protein [Candidatus Dependentiae bacterium]
MKKILHIITKLEFGGAQINTVYSVNHFASAGNDVTLITGSGGILDKKLIDERVKLIEIPELIRNINPFYDFISMLKLYFIIKKHNFDIVHTHSSKAGILGRIAAKLAGTKKILHTVHGWGFSDKQNYLAFRMFVILEQITAFFTDKIIAVANDNIAKGLKNKIGKKNQYTVIRSGIDFEKFEKAYADSTEKKNKTKKNLGVNCDDLIIVMIGCFKPQKNPIEFIKIASVINKKYNNIKFILVGDGALRKDIENEIQSNNLSDKVILAGWRTDVQDILAASDIFCLTSLWEGLPRSILEAYSCRLPVVATEVDGTPEVVINNKTGFLYSCGKIEDAVKYLELLISDKSKRLKFGENGYDIVNSEFSVQKMLADLEKLY